MKKLISIFLVALIAVSSTALVGCFKIDEATKKEIAGTYKLTRYLKSGNEDNTVDYIADKKTECYLVIPEEGNGYYVFSDENTEPIALEAQIAFEESTEAPGKYGYVSYFTDQTVSPEKLGYSKGTLNKSYPVFGGSLLDGTLTTDFIVYVDYKKVDGAQDLSYVKKVMPDVAVYKSGEYAYNGYFNKSTLNHSVYISYAQADVCVYYIVKLDSVNKKATEYYMLKSDMVRHANEVDYSLNKDVDEYGTEIYKLGLGDKVCNTARVTDSNKFFSFRYSINVSEGQESVEMFLNRCDDITDGNLEETISVAIEEYENSLAQ